MSFAGPTGVAAEKVAQTLARGANDAGLNATPRKRCVLFGNGLPNRDPPDVTRFKAAAAKRVQAHRARARMGLRCLTVRVSDRIVRHLISTGYLSLKSREEAAAVACALEAWIYDNLP